MQVSFGALKCTKTIPYIATDVQTVPGHWLSARYTNGSDALQYWQEPYSFLSKCKLIKFDDKLRIAS